jgi:hypothetical protein
MVKSSQLLQDLILNKIYQEQKDFVLIYVYKNQELE